MKAMILSRISPMESKPLELREVQTPKPESGQLLVKISSCGICHTELDEIEGRLPSKLPIILGHQIVGRVEAVGPKATKFKTGDRVGITWLNWSCGRCSFCLSGQENLCERARFTGKDADGGYGEYTVVSENFAYSIPERFADSEAAPLLCAGVIGYRALRMTSLENGQVLGLYGFGSSAHITIKVAKYMYPRTSIYVITRSQEHRRLAKQLGANWTGGIKDTPPEKIDCAIDFTPAGETIREALKSLNRGGRLVINAIRKTSSIPELDYELLWHEKEIKTVANIAGKDAEEFLSLAAEIPIVPTVREFNLEEANEALILLKQGRIQGSGVLEIPH